MRANQHAGFRGRVQGVRTPSLEMTTNTTHYVYSIALTLCSPLYSYTKSAVSFDMYSQQFTLSYCLAKSLLLRIRFYNLFYVTSQLRHSLVSGAPPRKKNPGSTRDVCYMALAPTSVL